MTGTQAIREAWIRDVYGKGHEGALQDFWGLPLWRALCVRGISSGVPWVDVSRPDEYVVNARDFDNSDHVSYLKFSRTTGERHTPSIGLGHF